MECTEFMFCQFEKMLDELTDYQAAVAHKKNIEQCLFYAQYNTPHCSSKDTNNSVPAQQMAPLPATYPSTLTLYPSTSTTYPSSSVFYFIFKQLVCFALYSS